MSERKISVELPVLDLSQPVELPILSSLSQACQEWGFFYFTNHGIPENLFSKISSLSYHIFSLPLDSKHKLGPSSSLKTYTPHFIASPYFESQRVSGPDLFTSAKISANESLLNQKSEFSEILQEYGNLVVDLLKRMMKLVLMTLGDGYDIKFQGLDFSDWHGYLRIINYPPPKLLVEEKQVDGLGMHTDMSFITIVYQDEIGGLR